MSTRKQDKAAQNFQQNIWQLSKANSEEQMQWLLRSLIVSGRQPNLAVSGFVLPTVAMVSLVVVLLTTALMVRSFDRSRSASNFRVNETVLNAATPALDRARAKINALLADPTLPQETPTNAALEKALNRNSYALGDETRLKLVNDIDTNNTIQTNETLNTAWRFPVDTDSNGKFDSYTLYGIYFRSPTNGVNRSRNPIAARTSPMDSSLGSQCENAAGTSTSLVGDSGWYKSGAKLTKSFFVYTATVPVTTPPVGDTTNYEVYKGNKGFSALEFQQDRSRIPISNNAVAFQNDLELTPDSPFRLNGRISTNANFLIGSRSSDPTRLFQVSSKNSCFYTEENSKITVGGNVAIGNVTDTSDQGAVTIDLFNGFGNDPVSVTLDGSNKSITSAGGAEVAFNDAAYNQRIALMKQTALSYHPDYNQNGNTIDKQQPTVVSVTNVPEYPQEVSEGFADKLNAPGSSGLNAWDILAEQIEIYLKNRTRRVPYSEVPAPDGTGAIVGYTGTNVFELNTIQPIAAWREPTEANTRLQLNSANLPQTEPEQQQKDGKETNVGDRISVGNNLPAYWKNEEEYVTGSSEKQLVGTGINWTGSDQPRDRTTQVTPLPDARIADRNGFWEDAAAQQPATSLANVGGLRVITGAGIYVDGVAPSADGTGVRGTDSFLPIPPPIPGVTNPIVWSDSMPMTVGGQSAKGDLQMRATAVYHYKDSAYSDADYINRTPTACISSYYDPTNSLTARNSLGLPDVSGGIDTNGNGDIDQLADGSSPAPRNAQSSSNNGVVYPAPYDNGSRDAGVSTYRAQLNRQVQLVFPDGRIVNQPLKDALVKIDDVGGISSLAKLSLTDNSAIDTAICALRILDDSLNPSPEPVIPHGAIKEASFLDARQVKAIDKTLAPDKNEPISQPELSSSNYQVNNNYNLALEQRQPLEIRVTDIDLRQLAETEIPGEELQQEYFLPNSGIIYAGRDDALLDLSVSNTEPEKELLSPTDFKLDPTRRPNGIRLINGSNLAREDNFREEEKGLILATNLPTYIQGDFNLHKEPETNTTPIEEFLDKLNNTWTNFYDRSEFNNNFACRQGQPGCGNNGDQWRPATIISDATTVLSNSFVDGFRDQGDYDLRNNIGSSVTQARQKNGFFDNNFVTSADWAGNNGFPTIASRNSYLTNGVTPIQRRTNFSEYVMEICRKFPVSECGPNDWVVGYDVNGNGILEDTPLVPNGVVEKTVKANELDQVIENNGGSSILNGTQVDWSTPFGTANRSLLDRLGAGTTAKAALSEERRYARRVAFGRDEDGRLTLTDFVSTTNANNTKNAVRPLGVGCSLSGCEYPDNRTPAVNTNYGTLTSKALWFRTTNNQNGEPGETADITYASDKPLYYLPPGSGEKLILPDTPDIPGISTSLNSPGGNQSASDYAVCLKNGGVSQSYTTNKSNLTKSPGNDKCPSTTNNTIDNFLGIGGSTGLLSLSQTTSDSLTAPGNEITGGTLTAQQPLNVYKLPKNKFANGATITLNSGGQPDAIFVIQANDSIVFGDNCPAANDTCGAGVVLNLEGVNPNNVFWAINGAVQFENVKSPHQLQGNFIGKGAVTLIGKNTQILGRLLGFTNAPTIGDNATITAITSDGQPSLVPVLQIHSPEGSPSSNLERIGEIQDEWLQQVEDNTTVNAVFVSGNSPSRKAEESAGLQNFVRLLENWETKTLDIKGSFIQFKRSAYATAPLATVLADKSNANDGSLSIFGYDFTQYRTDNGTPNGTLPYYNEPNRQWSFDVGILSQSPDIFAQKFTQEPVNPANEFFREVSRDDEWIETLLCAAAQDAENNYTSYAIDASERPTECPALTAYNAPPAGSDSSNGG